MIKLSKYKVINADNSVDIFHFQTNADIVVDGTTKRVPTITEISRWNSATLGGVNTFIGTITALPSGYKANDIWFKII